MSSSNYHSHMETSWKTYYHAKKILRQTEQRLKDAREYYPHVHLNNHRDTNDLSTHSTSSSYLLHGDTSSIHAGNRSILNDDKLLSTKHQLLDVEALQTIRRKINKQKIAAERRAEQIFHSQSDAGFVFEPYTHNTYATSSSLQNLHYTPHRQQRFSPPKLQQSYSSHLPQSQSFPSELDVVLRNSTSSKLLLGENDFERPSTTIRSTKENYLLTNGRSTQQRSASATTNLTTKYQDILNSNDSQQLKHIRRVESAHATTRNGLTTPDSWRTDFQPDRSIKKNSTVEILTKRIKPNIEETITGKIIKSKRDTSASKPTVIITEKTPLKPISTTQPKSDDDKRKLQEYIQQKRQQHDEILTNGERGSKDKLKKLNESNNRTTITPKDLTEQTRQRLMRLLEPSTKNKSDHQFEQTSSSSSSSLSSSSSSADSMIEIQQTKSNETIPIRSRSEPPIENNIFTTNEHRHENLLRWAVNLTRDCDIVENRFKYFRTNENVSPSYQLLENDDGNFRYSSLNYGINPPRTIKSSNLSDYQTQQERVTYRDEAAAKIQAAYRGYTVRKTLSNTNGKIKHLDNEFNKRPNYRESSSINIELRLPEKKYSIDSPVLHHYENHQQQYIRKSEQLPSQIDVYDNQSNEILSGSTTPINHKQIPLINSSKSTTPIPSPGIQVPFSNGRRRSLSPPLPPQMSPDNGRPLNHLNQITVQHPIEENRETKSLINQQINSSPQQIRISSIRQISSTNRKHPSPSSQQQQTTITTQTHNRTLQNSSPVTSSSESILTAREKRVRQKFNSDIELQAYEKRLKDIEKKIRQLVKRAFEIFDEKRSLSSPPTGVRITESNGLTNLRLDQSHDDSTISEDKSFQPKGNNSDTSSMSSQRQSDVLTSDVSDLERCVVDYRKQLKAKKLEFERLKQRKNKEDLRRQESALKKQIESYDKRIRALASTAPQQEQTVPIPSESINSSLTEKTKSNLPLIPKSEKQILQSNHEKELSIRPVETPGDERDTQHDAQSISNIVDIQNESENDNDSQRSSIFNNKESNFQILLKDAIDSQSSSLSVKVNEKPVKPKSPSPTPAYRYIKSPSPQPSESTKDELSLSEQKSQSSSKSIHKPIPSIKSPLRSAEERIQSPFQPIKSLLPTLENSQSSASTSAKSLSPSEEQSQSSKSSKSADKRNQLAKSPSPLEEQSQSTKSLKSLEKRESLVKSQILQEERIQSIKSPVFIEENSQSSKSLEILDQLIKSSIAKQERIQSVKSPVFSEEESQSTKSLKSSEKREPLVKSQILQEERIQSSKSLEIPDQLIKSSIAKEEHTQSVESPVSLEENKQLIKRDISPKLLKSPSSSSSSSISYKSPPPPPEKEEYSQSSSKSIKSPLPIEELSQSLSEFHKSVSISKEPIFTTTKQISTKLIEQKSSEIVTETKEYDEDFSEDSPKKSKIEELDIESIQEELEDKRSTHDTNQSTTSKSSADEQSQILVIGKVSANNTPRQQDENTLKDETPPIPLPLPPPIQPLPISTSIKTESDDTSHDASDNEDVNETYEEDTKFDKLAETLVRTFTDEAIDHGKIFENLKAKDFTIKDSNESKSDDESTDGSTNKQPSNAVEDDTDALLKELSKHEDFIDKIDTPGPPDVEKIEIDLSRLEEKIPEEPRITAPVVPHTPEQVNQLCHNALTILYDQNDDFSDRSSINRTIPNSYYETNEQIDSNEDIKRNRHAYCRMIFDLTAELLYEMHSPTIRSTKYPEWQKRKLIPKRFYRLNPPRTRDEAENFIQRKILEILNLNPRQIMYSKWRTSIRRSQEIDQFEMVLDEELRRTEIQWIDYEDDCIQIKFDTTEFIFDQLIHETLVECLQIINKKSNLSSNNEQK